MRDAPYKRSGFSKAELTLLTGSTLFSLVIACLLVSDYSLLAHQLEPVGLPIAAIDQSTNTVKRRPAALPVWDQVNRNEGLYDHDHIYTGSNSTVTVSFNEDDEITLSENTLVVIERFDAMATVLVKQGVILANVSSGSKQLQIQTGDSRTVLRKPGTRALIESSAGKASVSVLSGEAEIETGDESLKVHQDERVELQKQQARLETPTLKLSVPSLGVQQNAPVNSRKISWSRAAGAKSYLLEIARDSGFENVAHKLEIPGNTSVLPANLQGAYFVRAAALTATGVTYSLKKPIFVAAYQPPKLTWPPEGKTFNQKNGEFVTFVAWDGADADATYHVLLATDPDFKTPVVDQLVNVPSVRTPSLSHGTYYVKVGRSGGAPEAMAWSRTRAFHVEREQAVVSLAALPISEPAVVEAPTPVEETIAVSDALGPDSSVKPVPARRPDESPKKISNRSTPLPQPKEEPIEQIAAVPTAEQIESSIQQTPEQAAELVVPKAPGLLFPIGGTALNFDEYERKTVVLRWNGADSLNGLKVVIAKDKQLSQTISSQIVSRNSATVVLPDDGTYYWELQGLDKQAKVAVRSQPSSFSISTTPVNVAATVEDGIRMEALYIPSRVNIKHNEVGGNQLNLKAQFQDSYQLALRGWLNEDWGFDLELAQHWTKVTFDVASEDVRSKNKAKFDYIESGGALRRRWTVFRQSYPVSLGVRLGYYYQPWFTFFEQEIADSEEDEEVITYGLVASDTHSVVTGLEAQLPLARAFNLETRVDYLHFVSADLIDVSRSMNYLISSSVVGQIYQNTSMSFGGTFRAQEYKYEDEAHETKGSNSIEAFGIIYGFGYLF